MSRLTFESERRQCFTSSRERRGINEQIAQREFAEKLLLLFLVKHKVKLWSENKDHTDMTAGLRGSRKTESTGMQGRDRDVEVEPVSTAAAEHRVENVYSIEGMRPAAGQQRCADLRGLPKLMGIQGRAECFINQKGKVNI